MPDAGDPYLATRRHKMFHIFHFIQCDMVFGIVHCFWRTYNAIFSEKRYLISIPFLLTYIDVGTVKFFPPAESRLISSNFKVARLVQGVA